jgi:PhzF family phenazine biosynthesis protein
MDLAFRILNVFAVPGDRLSGNPLCVFEDGRRLAPAQMQALARQLNLSETTFVLPPATAGAAARVRIFTPELEMPFAGHPTLGTAHVVRALGRAEDRLVLETAAGPVALRAAGDRWTLSAPRAAAVREPEASPDALAAMLGLPPGSVARARWVDTGALQLLVQVQDAAAVRAARPEAAGLAREAGASGGATAYVFAEIGPEAVLARCFFTEKGAALEDPATGSACANLGGWLAAAGTPLPARREISQGAQVGRPSLLWLEVDAQGLSHVSGEVVELGRGVIGL